MKDPLYRKDRFWPFLSSLSGIVTRIFSKRALFDPDIRDCFPFDDDFIFKGKMKQHALRGRPGSEVTELLDVQKGDVILPKRRFSAFFKTDLDQTLRTWGCDTIVVGGITTNVCVLMTAMDALCHDFKAILLEDCCAAHKKQVHETTLENYRNFALYPLFRIMTSVEFLQEVEGNRK